MREHKTDGTKCWCKPKIIKVKPISKTFNKKLGIILSEINKDIYGSDCTFKASVIRKTKNKIISLIYTEFYEII